MSGARRACVDQTAHEVAELLHVECDTEKGLFIL
jgi:hypothetical protein